ncbi:hypothetical protein PV326_005080 [Microctonus aethiopoides]|nr:hypothetical protein PV326_005080 [Microctonus aethiopoides]
MKKRMKERSTRVDTARLRESLALENEKENKKKREGNKGEKRGRVGEVLGTTTTTTTAAAAAAAAGGGGAFASTTAVTATSAASHSPSLPVLRTLTLSLQFRKNSCNNHVHSSLGVA